MTKTLITILLCAGLLAPGVLGQQKRPRPTPAPSPTLEETKTYIINLLQAEVVLPGELIKYQEMSLVIEHVEKATFIGCKLMYDVSASSDRMTSTYSQELELSTVNTISTATMGDVRPYSMVTLRLSRPVTRTEKITPKVSDIEFRETKRTLLEVSFYIRNEDTAGRLQKAFAAATGKCGAKPDPFATYTK